MTQIQDQDREWSRTHVYTLGRYRPRDLPPGNMGEEEISAVSWELEREPEIPSSVRPNWAEHSSVYSIAKGVSQLTRSTGSGPAMYLLLLKGDLCVDSNIMAS